ncbi:hypothetical protein DSECCO2_646770 [anaerobic digester metagenome]
MEGVAVKVTADPAQVGLLPEVMAVVTPGVTTGLMVIVIPELVAVAGLTQVAFEVITQVTT